MISGNCVLLLSEKSRKCKNNIKYTRYICIHLENVKIIPKCFIFYCQVCYKYTDKYIFSHMYKENICVTIAKSRSRTLLEPEDPLPFI